MVPISTSIPSGFRLLYIDELVNSATMRNEVKRLLGSWKIAVVLNGYAKGSGYGNDIREVCSEDTPNATDMLLV
jgi:hypothetical protein